MFSTALKQTPSLISDISNTCHKQRSYGLITGQAWCSRHHCGMEEIIIFKNKKKKVTTACNRFNPVLCAKYFITRTSCNYKESPLYQFITRLQASSSFILFFQTISQPCSSLPEHDSVALLETKTRCNFNSKVSQNLAGSTSGCCLVLPLVFAAPCYGSVSHRRARLNVESGRRRHEGWIDPRVLPRWGPSRASGQSMQVPGVTVSTLTNCALGLRDITLQLRDGTWWLHQYGEALAIRHVVR